MNDLEKRLLFKSLKEEYQYSKSILYSESITTSIQYYLIELNKYNYLDMVTYKEFIEFANCDLTCNDYSFVIPFNIYHLLPENERKISMGSMDMNPIKSTFYHHPLSKLKEFFIRK